MSMMRRYSFFMKKDEAVPWQKETSLWEEKTSLWEEEGVMSVSSFLEGHDFKKFGVWKSFDCDERPIVGKPYEVIVGKWCIDKEDESKSVGVISPLKVDCEIVLGFVNGGYTWLEGHPDDEENRLIERNEEYGGTNFYTRVLCWKRWDGYPKAEWLGVQVRKLDKKREEW